jgi:hypothetical protein
MKRQAVWAENANEPKSSMSRNAEHLSDQITQEASSLADDGKELASRGVAYAKRTINENPTLVLAGVVALGAIAAMAIMPRKSEPASAAKKLQRDLIRQTKDVRRAIRQELQSSGVSSRVDEIGKSLSAIDWKPYIQPFLDQASSLARQANEKISATVK